MRVRREQHALAERAHVREKPRRAGQEPDVLPMLALERDDVERQLLRPVVDAVPLERAAHGLEPRPELLERRVGIETATRGVMARQLLEPEEIVKSEVEDRAVHVEADGLDLGPVGSVQGRRMLIA